MTAFVTFVTGRYTRWFVIFAWVVVAAMAGSLQPKLQEETSNETISYLPGESDAATVAKLQKSAFESGAETPAVIVFTAGAVVRLPSTRRTSRRCSTRSVAAALTRPAPGLAVLAAGPADGYDIDRRQGRVRRAAI